MASCGEMPRSRSSSWAAVHARSIARCALRGSEYFSVRRTAASWVSATPVEKTRRDAFAGRHHEWRFAASSTDRAPSRWPRREARLLSSAAGLSTPRSLPRNAARSVS